MDTHKNLILSKIYYDPQQGLSSAKQLHDKVKKNGISLKYVTQWIKNQENNQIFKKQDKNIIYSPIIGQDNDFQADLMFLTQYKTKNSGFHIILNFMELTSRKAYSYKLKKKLDTINAFKSFIKDAKNINNLTVDKGSEFIDKNFRKIAKDNNINLIFVDVNDKTKMGKIERFNKTLRDKITKYQKTFKTLRWEDKLDDLVTNYNNSIHSSTGYKPNTVTQDIKEKIRSNEYVRLNEYKKFMNNFKIGDTVRLLKKKKLFQKGNQTYSKKIYVISNINHLSLDLLNKNGDVIERIKPYNVQIVKKIEKAPEIPFIEKHSRKENEKEQKLKNKQKREKLGNVDEQGNIIIPKHLKNTNEKRTINKKIINIGDKIKVPFTVNKKKVYYDGVIKEIIGNKYRVLFDDGDDLIVSKYLINKI